MRNWVILLVLTATSCGFMPRKHTRSLSPDGRSEAFVRQGANVDPPDDHLYLSSGGGPARLLMSLAPDIDWCRTIVWSDDSRTVGFLVSDRHLALYDVASGENFAMVDLIGSEGRNFWVAARDLTISNDRRSVGFERYRRDVAARKKPDGTIYEYAVVESARDPIVRQGESLGRQTLTIPNKRLKVEIEWPPGSYGAEAWFTMVAADKRQVTLPVPSARNRIVELPAFDDGPLTSLRIAAHGPYAELEDVAITNEPLRVTLLPPFGQ